MAHLLRRTRRMARRPLRNHEFEHLAKSMDPAIKVLAVILGLDMVLHQRLPRRCRRIRSVAVLTALVSMSRLVVMSWNPHFRIDPRASRYRGQMCWDPPPQISPSHRGAFIRTHNNRIILETLSKAHRWPGIS